MNIISFMQKVNAIGKYLIVAIFALNLMTLVTAGGGDGGSVAATNIQQTLIDLCNMSQTFLGLAAMVLIVLAGTIYAIGQVLGAETRARASVWATAMLTGAIIGILIYLIAPVLVGRLLEGSGITVTPDQPCGATGGGGGG
jgi:hypothetical protein